MKKIGPLIVGVAVIVNEKGNFLLSKRRSNVKEWQKWEVPGGIVEFGESVEDAVKREIKEELNIEIEIIDTIDFVFSNIWKLKSRTIHVILVGYVCKIAKGIPKPSDKEVEKIGWFKLDEVKKLSCLPGAKEFVEKAYEKLKNKKI
jgi:mutator protein MutT